VDARRRQQHGQRHLARLNQACSHGICLASSRRSKEPSSATAPATAGRWMTAAVSMSGKLRVNSSPEVVETGSRSTTAIMMTHSSNGGRTSAGAGWRV
jgi:hypothetical protein